MTHRWISLLVFKEFLVSCYTNSFLESEDVKNINTCGWLMFWEEILWDLCLIWAQLCCKIQAEPFVKSSYTPDMGSDIFVILLKVKEHKTRCWYNIILKLQTMTKSKRGSFLQWEMWRWFVMMMIIFSFSRLQSGITKGQLVINISKQSISCASTSWDDYIILLMWNLNS